MADIDVDNQNKNWIQIVEIQKIRNLFTHNRGVLSDIPDHFKENDKNDKTKSQEKRIAEANDLLSIGYYSNEVLIQKGYLECMLNIIEAFLREIDDKIKLKYPPIE